MQNDLINILIADDDPNVREVLNLTLASEGYNVTMCCDGQEALSCALKVLPHLIILDVNMPGVDGLVACAEIKKQPKLANSIVVFLTSNNADINEIAGFTAGADDYISKPVKPGVLIPRIKALLRRKNSSEPSVPAITSRFQVDKSRFMVVKDGVDVFLPRKEFELLSLLISKPGKVFTRNEIFKLVWGNTVIVGARTIDVHIRKIREKLGDIEIVTIKGVGYKYIDSV
jgi:two-component system alkaline phosphatase synthesis response regulator PhoP